MILIRFYEENGVDRAWEVNAMDFWTVITLTVMWAGFLVLGPFHPGGTYSVSVTSQVTKIRSAE